MAPVVSSLTRALASQQCNKELKLILLMMLSTKYVSSIGVCCGRVSWPLPPPCGIDVVPLVPGQTRILQLAAKGVVHKLRKTVGVGGWSAKALLMQSFIWHVINKMTDKTLL